MKKTKTVLIAAMLFSLCACSGPVNPIMEADDGEFKNWYGKGCGSVVFDMVDTSKLGALGSPPTKEECVEKIKERVKFGKGIAVTQEQVLDPAVKQRYIKHYPPAS